MKDLCSVSREDVNKLIQFGLLNDWSNVQEDGLLTDGSQGYVIHFTTSDEQHRAYMLVFCNTLIEKNENMNGNEGSVPNKTGAFGLDELELLYMTVYDSESVEVSSGDDVLDFLNWCRSVRMQCVEGEE